MQLEKQVCSLNLAERLKELGVKQEGQFRWHGAEEEWIVRRYNETSSNISAFMVAELGEMLPWFIEKGADRYEMNMMKNGTKTPFSLFYDEYHSRKMLGDCLVEGATEADARAKMLIYILENNLCKTS